MYGQMYENQLCNVIIKQCKLIENYLTLQQMMKKTDCTYLA